MGHLAPARTYHAKPRYTKAIDLCDINSLIAIKSTMDHPRHQGDAQVLKRMREKSEAKK